MEINRRVNFGTPRGGGNIKGQDIEKIAASKDIDSYVKRINSVADLVDNDIIETQKTLSGQSPERAKNFKRAVMLTGVNDSSKENKFISGAYKLYSGEHLNENDKVTGTIATLESIDGIEHIINIMTYSIMIGGITVLSLILILWLRERIREIGILLSIGVSKIKIVTQFILELLFISLPSLVLSFRYRQL